MRGRTTSLAILVATVACAPMAIGHAAAKPDRAKSEAAPSSSSTSSKTSKSSSTSKAAHGAALERLPTACDTLVYVDLASLAAIDRNDADLVRDRARDAIDALGTGPWSDAASALRTASNALEAHGVPWRDVDEVAMCGARGDPKLVTLSGDFHGKDVVSAISGGVTRQGATVSEIQLGGARYAKIVAHDRRFFARPIADGVIGLAPEPSTLDDAARSTLSLPGRQSGARNVFWLRATLADGHAVESTLLKVPGTPAEHLLTTVITKRGGFDGRPDVRYYEKLRDDWASQLRNGPLAPLAPAIGSSIVTADHDHLQIQAVLHDDTLQKAVAQAARARPSRWSALFERPTEPSTAIGGGPSSGASSAQPSQSDVVPLPPPSP